MDRVNKLVKLLLLELGERARLLVASSEVNVEIGHGGARAGAGGKLKCSCARAAGFACVVAVGLPRQAAEMQSASACSLGVAKVPRVLRPMEQQLERNLRVEQVRARA